MLRCRLNRGIAFVTFGHRSMECSFRPVSGPVQAYEGAINTVDLDLGVSEGGNSLGRSLVQQAECHMAHWRENTSGLTVTSASESVQGRVLVGGSNRSIALRPVSLEGSVAHNVVAGLSQLKLRPVQQ